MDANFGMVVDKANKAMSQTNMSANAKSIKELAYKAYIVASEQNIIVEGWLPDTFMVDVSAKYDAPFEQGLGAMSGLAGISSMARFLGLSLTTQAMTAQIWQGGSFIDITVPMIFQAETDAGSDVMTPIKQLLSLTMPKDPSGGGFLTAPGPRIDIGKLASNGASAALNTVVGAGKDIWSGVVAGATAVVTPVDTFNKMTSGNTHAFSDAGSAINRGAKELSSAIVNSVVNNISLYIGQFLYFPSVVITDVSPTYDVILGPDKNPLRAAVNVVLRTFYIPTSQDIDIMFPATQSRETTGYGNKENRL